MKVGEKIRQIRVLKGYKQEHVAELLGISSVAYGDIERGKSDPTLGRLSEIASVLEVGLVDLLTLTERVSAFFNNKGNAVWVNGHQYNDPKDIILELEKKELLIEKLQAEKEKACLEVRYWKEKYEGVAKV